MSLRCRRRNSPGTLGWAPTVVVLDGAASLPPTGAGGYEDRCSTLAAARAVSAVDPASADQELP